MNELESCRLATWSRAVRESSLKRLRLVPGPNINWRPTPDSMSFADLAQHLVESDLWLLEKLRRPDLAPMTGRAGLAGHLSDAGYADLLTRLLETGERRSALLEGLSDRDLESQVFDQRFGGSVSLWWMIVRGNLDHEIHHRGQLAGYLRMVACAGPSAGS